MITAKSNPGPILRWSALGGLEEVGRNSMFFEYDNEIVVIDLGLQFPEEETPGIDYIIPNTAYLESRKQNIKAVILTHAHYDHIGAIPYIIQKIGNPRLITTALTKEIINKRQEEMTNAPKLNVEIVKEGDRIQISDSFSAEFFGVTHNIPDTIGIILDTPVGKIIHPGEFKIDYDDDGKPTNLNIFKKIGQLDVQALLLDSTNAEKLGLSIPEKTVQKNIRELFEKARGRIVVGTFASLLDRLAEIIKTAEKMNKTVMVSGFSMKTNIQIAQNLGYMKFKKGLIAPIEEIHKYKDEKIVILCTGAQGEPNASLMRIANGEHRHVQVKATDIFIFSSSVIAGNERSVQILKDNITRQGAKVYTSAMMDIHSSGHATQEEIRQVIKLVKPKFFIPIHGYYFMRFTNAELAAETGVKKENIIVADNGQIVEMTKSAIRITDKTVPASYVLVDGLGIGDVGEVVLRDRRVLAQEGMVVVITTLDRKTGRIIKNPDIISRGFIYLKESQPLLDEIRKRIRGVIGRIPRYQPLDVDYLKSLVRDQIGQFLYTRTKRRPMILPVVIEV